MSKTAVAFLTKNNYQLSRQSMRSLVVNQLYFDLWWIDGSTEHEAEQLPYKDDWGAKEIRTNVGGGPDAAVVFALTKMLADHHQYDYVGLCEQDVLLPPDWFDRTMALFNRGDADGLEVGAASPRAYEDRVLIQRDGYAVMHNLGWGVQVMTRRAAQLALKYFRTGWTTDNRRLFMQLTGKDIGTYWAFRAAEHWLCADWNNDRVLAAHGLASLALTPSPVQMIGQTPPLAEQGLHVAEQPVESLRGDAVFRRYAERTRAIRNGEIVVAAQCDPLYRDDQGGAIYFPHQVCMLEGAFYAGDWRLRFAQGFGPFAWQAGWDGKSNVGQKFSDNIPRLTVMISGSCEFMVSGGPKGGQWLLEDTVSGYSVKPVLPAESGQTMSLVAPCGVSHRALRLTALTPGVTFYGLRCREPQPVVVDCEFDHSVLPESSPS